MNDTLILGIILAYRLILIGITCYMCANHSPWWVLLLLLNPSVSYNEKKVEE